MCSSLALARRRSRASEMRREIFGKQRPGLNLYGGSFCNPDSPQTNSFNYIRNPLPTMSHSKITQLALRINLARAATRSCHRCFTTGAMQPKTRPTMPTTAVATPSRQPTMQTRTYKTVEQAKSRASTGVSYHTSELSRYWQLPFVEGYTNAQA